jgi:hypothetical protein
MPREPAYGGKRRQDAESAAAIERAKDRMSVESVRRWGVGSPELTPQEVASRRNGRVCGIQTVARTRSERTTNAPHTTRSFDAAIAPPKHTATSPPATRGRSW